MNLKRVICDLPNAALEISGVSFTKLDDGRIISEPISEDAAGRFTSIKGYVLAEELDEDQDGGETPPAPPAPASKPDTEAAQPAEKPLTKKEQQAVERAAKKKADDEAKAAEEAAKTDNQTADDGDAGEGATDDNPEDESVF